MRKIIFSDVTARDGLQSLKKVLSLNDKIKLVNLISKVGFKEIEVGSLVNEEIIPSMKGSLDVYKKTMKPNKFKSILLAGNENSIDIINKEKIKYFSLFTSPSNTFNIKNINTDVNGSFIRFKKMLDKIEDKEFHYIKGYISCIGDCPYEGDISFEKIIKVVERFKELNIDEICIADTIAKLKSNKLDLILKEILKIYNQDKISLHLHVKDNDNLLWKENLDVAIKNNIYKFDTSISGIGGCPAVYSSEKSGNLDFLNAYLYFKDKGYHIDSELDISYLLEIDDILHSI